MSLAILMTDQLSMLESEFPVCARSTLDGALESREKANLNLWRVIIGIAFGRLLRNYGRVSQTADSKKKIVVGFAVVAAAAATAGTALPRCLCCPWLLSSDYVGART